MDILYTIFIYPIVYIFTYILNILTPHIGYCTALLAIACSMSFALIPLKKWAKKIQQKEQDIHYKIYPALLEIKQKYRGEKQFYKTEALYKKHNYHPIKSMRSTAGLAVQIPFFLGAYYALSTYQPTQPYFYGLDLTKADGLIFGIHILPFIMASVTVYIAHISNVKNSLEKYGFALFFLVLLYNSPSALILYWTANMICNSIIERVLVK